MQRFILDNGVYDELLRRPNVVEALRRKVAEGAAELLITHVHDEQIAGAPLPVQDLYESLRGISRIVPTSVIVLDATPLGQGRRSSDKHPATFDANLRSQPRHLATDGGVLCGSTQAHPVLTADPDAVTCSECREALGQSRQGPLRYRHTGDALLIDTARREAATFVTTETRRAVSAAHRHDVPVQSVADFFSHVLARP